MTRACSNLLARRFRVLLRGAAGLSLALGVVGFAANNTFAADSAKIESKAKEPAPVSGKVGADSLWAAHVEPLLSDNCYKCHGGAKQKSGLDLRDLNFILKGGEHGPAIVPGRPGDSLLYKALLPGADPHMPPAKEKQLSEEQIAIVKSWIEKIPVVAASPTLAGASKAAGWEAGTYATNQARVPVWVPPADMPAHLAVDHFIQLGWKERNAQASAACDDRAFARRIWLDLAGRIPTVAETEAFCAEKGEAKRDTLVQKLLDGEEYAVHLREVFDVVLMNRSKSLDERRVNHWHEYLEKSFRANRPWNRMVRDIIVARAEDEQQRGCDWFLYERKNNHQAMAEAVAPVAFGIQVKCAQCHNHPLAREIEQRHYWGLVTAFNRSKNVETQGGRGIAESATGGFMSFANLKKETQPAVLIFPNGKLVAEERPADGVKEEDSADKYLVPPPPEKEKGAKPATPKFSRRGKLAEAVTLENPALAKAFVNRMWALLLGRGFVHPVDLMDSKHPASHPDLLDWLARDFERNGYDIKRLVRVICSTRAYQLDSRPAGSVAPAPEAFACGLDKPLSAESLFRSLLVATTGSPKCADDRAKNLEKSFLERFPDLFAAEYNATLHQATFLSNNPGLDEFLSPKEGNTMSRLLAEKEPRRQVDQAFLMILGRFPAEDEAAQCLNYLKAGEKKPADALKQMVWALLASAEFQVNH